MNPKTANQNFKEWLAKTTIDELKEELLTLSETDLSIHWQVDQYELKRKTETPSQESQEWRLRAGHSLRWVYHQRRAIEHRLEALKTELKAENNRLNVESAKLKHEQITSRDRLWIEAAKMVLDTATFGQITNVANELISAADRESAQ